MLKHTGINFELLTDIDMVMFVERGIRGGLSQCSSRYARPFADFRWVDDISNFNVMDVTLDSPTGYILEVDLEYSQQLHDAHADLRFVQRAINRPVNVKTSSSPLI